MVKRPAADVRREAAGTAALAAWRARGARGGGQRVPPEVQSGPTPAASGQGLGAQTGAGAGPSLFLGEDAGSSGS